MKPIVSVLAILLISLPAAAASVADNYKAKCVMCHGPDGSASTPMGKKLAVRDLRSAEIQSQTDAQLSAMIENGKGKMPGQKGRLSKDELRQLVTHIRGLARKG
ncbi:MAG: cytochrome c [Acidobacteria bacterium]|nr:cytochrome c [Acidobacteriota bacterium]